LCSDGRPHFSVYIDPNWCGTLGCVPSRAARTPPAGRMCTSGWYLVYHRGSWQCYLGGNTTRSGIRQ
jgi:hypothetical protein